MSKTVTYTDAQKLDLKSGTRVILLRERKKDGAGSSRKLIRISSNEREWDEAVEELVWRMRPGERVYASLCARNVPAASRLLKHRIIDLETGSDPLFFEKLNTRWSSCLMNPSCELDKKWMFDCDNPDEYVQVAEALNSVGVPYEEYATKNGRHVIVKPFNRTTVPFRVVQLIQHNPLALIAYTS